MSGDAPQELEAKEVIVATGSQARSVPGIEIDRRRIITSDEAIHLKEVPASMVILGSGAVGVEFASIFNRFGTKVTIVELLPRLVPLEDEAISARCTEAFRKQGITAHTGTTVTSARVAGEGVEIEAQALEARRSRSRPDYLLVATGRGPVIEGLGAEDVGLAIDRGYLVVDDLYPDERARHLGHRRRHHGGGAAPAARARVVGRRHPRRRAARR